jgi:hypothetical protein
MNTPITRADIREHISNATDDLDFVSRQGLIGRDREADDPKVVEALDLIDQANDLLSRAYDVASDD